MRVLVLTNLYPNAYQPTRAAFNRQQLAALATMHAVRVIAPIAWTDEWRARRKGRPPLPPGRTATTDGIPVHHPRYLFPPKVFRNTYGSCFLECVRRSFDIAVREFRPDVLFSLWAYPDGWAAVRLARRAGLPLAIKVHGSDVLLADHYRGRAANTAEALRAADAVIAVSYHLADHVREQGVDPARIHVVDSGVNAELFCPGPRDAARARLGLDDTPLVLFVGNLVPVKGLDTLLAACAKLRDAGETFRCTLVGQGPLRESLEAEIAARGLGDQVKLIGPRPLEELPHWYRAANVLALPSYSEGIPNVILEARACDIPVVASRVGGIPEILPAENTVNSGDPTALAEALRAVLRGVGQMPEGYRPGTWRDSAATLAGVLESIVTRRKAAA